jgi:methanogenic corrinoid protein MtbC1
MIDLDEEKFENLITELTLQYGFDKTILSVVYPFLHRIGVLWQTGNISVAQEHFVSNIIKRKIIVAIDKLGPAKQNSKATFISFLPEWEYHELSLLFYTYILRKSGFSVVYLGQAVPVADLISVQNSYNAEYLLLTLTTTLPDETIFEYLSVLSKTFKKSKVFVYGNQVNTIEFKKLGNLVKIKSPEIFEELVSKIKLH